MNNPKLVGIFNKLGQISFWLAVLCSILFSLSGWLVKWLGESFVSTGQLVVRAGLALIVSILWLLISSAIEKIKNKTKVDDDKVSKFNLKNYKAGWLTVVMLCRPVFNLCFILSITAETATIALLILLFVKMLTNVVIDSIENKEKISLVEIIGYLFVTSGILVYGWGSSDMFQPVLVFAFVSGLLEAIRLWAIGKLAVDKKHQPVFAVIEFVGMLIVAGFLLLVAFFTQQQWFFVNNISIIDVKSIVAMIIFPIQTVGILAIDYYIVSSKQISNGLYSAILATELGFAGVINMIVLKTPFGLRQILGVTISMVAIMVIKLIADKKLKEKEKSKK